MDLFINFMQNDTNQTVSFIGALAISFIILKLVGVIHWRWLWVLSPIWLSLAFVGLVMIVGFVWWALTDHYDDWD